MRILLFLLLSLFLAGCARPAMPTTSHVEFRDRVERDSIFVHDSVHIERQRDTVWVTRERWRSVDRYVRDTVVRRDSIPYPVEVVRVEKHVPALYRWSLWVAAAGMLFFLWKLFN